MAQFWNFDPYDLFSRSADAVMIDIEKMLNALFSNFSGSSAPADGIAGSTWYDTGGSGLRFRNNALQWKSVLTGDQTLKMWVHANSACEGWVVDGSAITDAVIALKGAGGTQYKSSGGGASDGSWEITGATVASHTHVISDHIHQIYRGIQAQNVYDSNGNPTILDSTSSGNYGLLHYYNPSASGPGLTNKNLYTAKGAGSVNTGSSSPGISGDSTWRPKAAVGTQQYPNSPT